VTSREDSASAEEEAKDGAVVEEEEEEDYEEEDDMVDENDGNVHSLEAHLNRQGSHLSAFNQPSGRLSVPVPSLAQASV